MFQVRATDTEEEKEEEISCFQRARISPDIIVLHFRIPAVSSPVYIYAL
jgi:hypothetical protein